ncbi:MAG: hypothetical protein ABSE57_17595 [Bryobacteraceae bacterium]
MHCLYCKKRLWLFFSKERLFCSSLHEAAYHDELSAMNRLVEFTVTAEPPPNGPATADQKRTQRERESRLPMLTAMTMASPAAVPPLCSFVVERGQPQPVPCDLPATASPLEAKLFGGQIQFPSCQLLSASTAREITPIGIRQIEDTFSACRTQSKRSRRVPPTTPAAFSLRTHRRRVR